jgi:transcriptional antiterminator RfaH
MEKGTRPKNGSDDVPACAWFCLRSHPKHEHIAASHLRQIEGVEVYNPRIRFPRTSRQGPIYVTEALFPNYLFAKFEWKNFLTRVHYAPGVAGVVHFGTRWPTIPDEAIEELRESLGQDDVHIVPRELREGDQVQISGGAFHGLQAVVTKVLPGRQRVTVLLDFLGRQTMVEVGLPSIIKQGIWR